MRLSPFLCCTAVVVASMGAAGCGDGNAGHFEARLVGPSQVPPLRLSIQPSTVAPEFVAHQGCPIRPGFRARLSLDFATDRARIIRGLHFRFTDRTGALIPASAMRTSAIAGAPGSHPVMLPSASPIPIPDSLPFYGEPISPAANTLFVVVDFDCGASPDGTLTVEAEAADDRGDVATARATVRIGR